MNSYEWLDVKKISHAAIYAAEAHRKQFRKYTGELYIVHPERVAGSILEWLQRSMVSNKQVATDMVCVGWLHDVLEDCPGYTHEGIETEFGVFVADYVSRLTNPSQLLSRDSEGKPKLVRGLRKKIDRDHMAKQPQLVKVIKLLDRIDNTKGINHADDDWKIVYADESDRLAEVLKDGDDVLYSELKQGIINLRKTIGQKVGHVQSGTC